MNEDIRHMIDIIKNINKNKMIMENSDFILNNDNVKVSIWVHDGHEEILRYNLGYEQNIGLYVAHLIGGEFANTYGQGKTEEEAVTSLKIRLMQLRNKNNAINEDTEFPQIDIKSAEPDERSNQTSNVDYHVNYQMIINNSIIEIDGDLVQYQGNYQFEPTYFRDTQTEEYYDNNWDKIEDEILSKFNEENNN